MLRAGWLTLVAMVLTACTAAVPSAAQYPLPIPSAAQPGAASKGDVDYARRGADAIRAALKAVDPEEALEQLPVTGLQLSEQRVAAGCTAAPGAVPILLCHFGPSVEQPVAQIILWHQFGAWRSQLYPQAPKTLAAERLKAFADHGCRIGCYSAVRQARQAKGLKGPELLVVVDLGYTAGMKAEEAQLLQLDDRFWEVAWVPGEGDWNYGHAEVSLTEKGIDSFRTRSSSWLRQDRLTGYVAETESGEHRRFAERWVRKGSAFLLKDQLEESSPYSTLLKLIHYLSTGADEKAMDLISGEIDLERAREALAQRPQRKSWDITRWGKDGYLIDVLKTGKPSLGVRFEHRPEGWVLVEIMDPKR